MKFFCVALTLCLAAFASASPTFGSLFSKGGGSSGGSSGGWSSSGSSQPVKVIKVLLAEPVQSVPYHAPEPHYETHHAPQPQPQVQIVKHKHYHQHSGRVDHTGTVRFVSSGRVEHGGSFNHGGSVSHTHSGQISGGPISHVHSGSVGHSSGGHGGQAVSSGHGGYTPDVSFQQQLPIEDFGSSSHGGYIY